MAIAGSRVAGRYTLVRPLGQGASSRAYLALGDDGQPYTVKLFFAELLGQAEREARMQVRHPHLAQVLTLSSLNGQPAVVLRYSPGVPLFERYARRPALHHESQAYLRTLTDVLDALSAMHQAGMLHRDVKPDNVLALPSGEARLIDYDLSGPVHEQFALPLRIGTEAYQSPEAGRGELLGPQSDLYGVGMLLYWGLCGTLPEGQWPSPGKGPLAELCRQLLHHEVSGRPGDAAQVRAELLAATP
ncbi:serine/threonine-protein kinase [Deinococcus sp.]|uniref:serine/threonine-protein kinase n=1 Tax=Deinococcus sp. TaxID=47478 RepID=UPI003B5C4E4F